MCVVQPGTWNELLMYRTIMITNINYTIGELACLKLKTMDITQITKSMGLLPDT